MIDGERTSDERRGAGGPRAKPCPACRTLVSVATRGCPECGEEFAIEERENKLAPVATASQVLSDDQPEGEWRRIRAVRVKCHEKGGLASIRLSYVPERSVLSVDEYLHFDSSSFVARRIAARRWASLSANPSNVPRSTAEALRMAADIVAPTEICVTKNAKGFVVVTGIRRMLEAA